MIRGSRPASRVALLAVGGLLLIGTPFVAILPGPGGVFVFAAGLALLLRNSLAMRRWFVRTMRRWPRIRAFADRAMRRLSARRRRERDRLVLEN